MIKCIKVEAFVSTSLVFIGCTCRMEKLLAILMFLLFWTTTSLHTVPVFSDDCKHFLVSGREGELIQTESVLLDYHVVQELQNGRCLVLDGLATNLIGQMQLFHTNLIQV